MSLRHSPRIPGLVPGRLLRLATALALGITLPLASAGTIQPVRAASSVSFGTPGSQATFGAEIRFDQPVGLDSVPTRVELLISAEGETSTQVEEVDLPSGAGSRTLTYSMKTPAGVLIPNETVAATWRLTFADGSIVEGPSTSVTYSDTRFSWRTRTGGLIRLHWYEGSDAFARQAINVGSAAIEKAASAFGVTETEPIDFFIYSTQSDFVDAIGAGAEGNVGGLAYPSVRTMFALVEASDLSGSWTSTVVSHELTHLVFDTATRNPYHDPPAWLNEGLAVYLSQGYGSEDRSQVRGAIANHTLVPLHGLIHFPLSTLDTFSLAYAESVSSVDFLARAHGASSIVTLVKSYADGASDDEALKAAIGTDVDGFTADWIADLGAAAPKSYGPQAAPVGPLPTGWSGVGSSLQPGGSGSSIDGGGTTSGAATGILIGIGALFVVVGGGILLLVLRGRRGGSRRSTPPPPPPSFGGEP